MSTAKERLVQECEKGGFDKYGSVMAKPVRDALIAFCEQNEEFERAVLQGGSFKDCMAAVGKKVKGNAISDMEAFGAAVGFYFPGAEIDVRMTIRMSSYEREEERKNPILDLSDFF